MLASFVAIANVAAAQSPPSSELPPGHPAVGASKAPPPSSSALPPGHPPLTGAPPAKAPPPSSSALPAGHPPIGGAPAKAPPPSSSALPPGHPAIDEPADDELPPGHPPARSGSRSMPAPETPPEDSSEKDDSLAPGTIVVEVRDKTDAPVPNADVTLGILQQSVAKGESRRRTTQKTDETGTARFENLERGAGIAYRVSVPWAGGEGDPATYAAPPFMLDLHHGQRVRVHVYPVTNRVEDALVGMQGVVYLELRDDVIQVDELFEVFNLGATTWVPSNVVVDLPRGFKAFNAQREMSDIGFDAVAERGAKLRGTFGPGQHQAQFRYQIPYEGGESANIALSLPPRVIRMRVIAEASKGMTLRVADFPNAMSDTNQRGTRVLLTERQARPGDQPLNRLTITLDNIPTEGSAKWVTVAITAATLAFGIYIAREQERSKSAAASLGTKDTERARDRLVAEIAALDSAAKAGEIGPQAHARIRQALIDSLARVMAANEAQEAT